MHCQNHITINSLTESKCIEIRNKPWSRFNWKCRDASYNTARAI